MIYSATSRCQSTVSAVVSDIGHLRRRSGFLPQSGLSDRISLDLLRLADTLLQRNNPGDREKAMSLLDESLAISNELGMRPLMERVLSRRDILKA